MPDGRKPAPAVRAGASVLKALFLVALGVAVGAAGFAVFFMNRLLAIAVWTVAFWLLLKGGRSLMAEFREAGRIMGMHQRVVPELERRQPCPCCGCPTRDPEEEDWTCLLCDWSDDDGVAIDAARQNFKRCLTVFADGQRPDWRPPLSADEIEAKQELLKLYAELVSRSSRYRWPIWYRVRELESDLARLRVLAAEAAEEAADGAPEPEEEREAMP